MKSREFGRSGLVALLLGLMILVGAQGSMAKSQKAKKAPDIVDTLAASGSSKQLHAAIKSAGLEKTLRGKGPFTVFAPTDEAFARSKGKLAEVMKDKKKLAEVLKGHVVPGRVTSDRIKSNGALKTAHGHKVVTQVKETTIWVDGAKVIQHDVPASNGMIFFIDEVLDPDQGN